jgi:hypothetical protein
MKIKLLGLLLLGVCFSSCASKETVYWTKKGSSVAVHHISRTSKGTHERIEILTTKVVTPAEIHEYNLGRMPNDHGGMDEAHRYYRVVQSESWDLRLPAEGRVRVTRGPKTVFTPPSYSPPPKDQRINDAVADANDAKEKLDAARAKAEEQTAENQAQLQALQAQTQDLAAQLQSAMSGPQRIAAPLPSPTPTDAAKAGAQAGGQPTSDPLVQWGQKQTQP